MRSGQKFFLVFLLVSAIFMRNYIKEKSYYDNSYIHSQGVTDSTILVGNSITTSGKLAYMGNPFKIGMEAYFAMINEYGGVNGRKIEYIYYDDNYNPQKATKILNDLISVDRVFAIVGHFGSPTLEATVSDLESFGIPTVAPVAGTPVLLEQNHFNAKNLFPVQPLYTTEGLALANWSNSTFNAEKVGVIYMNNHTGETLTSSLLTSLTDLGIKYTALSTTDNSANLNDSIDELLDADVDLIIVATFSDDLINIVKYLDTKNIDTPILTTYLNLDTNIFPEIDEMTENDYNVFFSTWIDTTELDDRADVETWASRVTGEKVELNYYLITGWLAAETFVEGIYRLDDEPLTWDNYIKAMEREPITHTFSGTIDYSNNSRIGSCHMGLIKLDPTSPSGIIDIEPIKLVPGLEQ